MKIICGIFSILFFSFCANARQLKADSISFKTLNQQRIETNKKGMIVLGSWAAINIISGGAGYFASNNDEWKAFHEMNVLWNIANGVIAIGGYMGAKKELAETMSCKNMLHRYEANKRLYLINAGLDVLYLGGGVLIAEHGKYKNNSARWQGFGKSIIVQGAFLLFFDSIMYASHQNKDKQWYRLLQGLCVTNDGIGLRYTAP